MIGNIITAGNMNELQTLIQIRGQYLKSYLEACKEKNIRIEPHKTKIVVINDTDSCSDDYIVGSILLPNSRAMFCLIEGDYNSFINEYYSKLDNDPDVQEYIAVLLAGMLERNFDYIFYFDTEDFSMYNSLCKALVYYLNSRYGVVCYSLEDCMDYPNIFITQSIIPEAIANVQNIVNNYRLSNRPTGQLFVQY